MKKQLLALVAGVAMTASAFAGDLESDHKDSGLSNSTVMYVESGLKFPGSVIKALVANVMAGKGCVAANYQTKALADVQVRERKNIACLVTVGNESAMILIDSAQEGIVTTLVLGGKVMHEVGQIGKEIGATGKTLIDLGKDGIQFESDFTMSYCGEFSGLICLAVENASNLLPVGQIALGSGMYVIGYGVHGLGEGAYFLANEGGNRINVLIDNAQTAERKALSAALEAGLLRPDRAIDNGLAALAAVGGAAAAVVASNDDLNDIQQSVDTVVEGTSVSIKFETKKPSKK